MLKRFCDRCGKEIKDEKFYGIAIRKQTSNIMNEVLDIVEWCEECKKKIFGKDERDENNT